jgi:hypothetical protein
MNLSANMVDSMLWLGQVNEHDRITEDLRARFDWIEPYYVARFGSDTIEKFMTQMRQVDKALLRRGLLRPIEIEIEDGNRIIDRRATRAGELMAEMLIEAGFSTAKRPPPPKVPLHPDDRPSIRFGVARNIEIDSKVDRRHTLAKPGDERWFA